jgi:hypothetical protein
MTPPASENPAPHSDRPERLPDPTTSQRRPIARIPAPLIGLATLAGIAAWLLIVGLKHPADFPAWYHCPFHLMTGLHCPGCGSTRATHALLNADPLGSLRNNPLLIVLGVPALLILARSAILRVARKPITDPIAAWGLPGWTGYAVLALVLSFWITRNIPHTALEPLRPIETHHPESQSHDPQSPEHAEHDHLQSTQRSGDQPQNTPPGTRP